MTIYDDILELIGNRIVHDTLYYSGKGEISRYDFWINKSNLLPYRLKIEMPHYTTVDTYKNLTLNKNKLEDFIASSYFPTDCPLKTKEKVVKKDDLLGKVAPDWVLTDSKNNTFALKELKSKILMIQFTSVNCGPCKTSIPFLNKLSTEFDKQSFDFVAIEAFTKNSNVLMHYQEKNGISYKLLMSTKDVTENYQIKSIPVFFLLDKNRVIRKIIRGYGIESTDKEIREAIKKML